MTTGGHSATLSLGQIDMVLIDHLLAKLHGSPGIYRLNSIIYITSLINISVLPKMHP